MNRLKVFLSIYILSFVLISCGSDYRRGRTIPPLPEGTEKSRREITLNFLSDAINASPGVSDNYYKRSLIYLEENRLNDALQDINDALDINGNIGSYYQTKALILRETKQIREALEAALKAEVLNSESPELYNLLGDLYQQLRLFNKAKLYLNKAVQISPNNGETYFFKGEIFSKLGDTTSALQLYEQTLALKPTYLPAYVRLSEVHTALRQYDIAFLYNNDGLKYYPKSAELFFQRGYTLQRSWKLDSAVSCYLKAVALDPKFVNASFNAGMLYFKSRAYRLALPQFEHTLKYNSRFPEIDFYMGQSLEYTGEYERAEEFYKKALLINPQDYHSLNGMYRIKRKLLYGETLPPDFSESDLPPDFGEDGQGRRVDTSLKQIQSIQPKSKLGLKTDSISRKSINPIIK